MRVNKTKQSEKTYHWQHAALARIFPTHAEWFLVLHPYNIILKLSTNQATSCQDASVVISAPCVPALADSLQLEPTFDGDSDHSHKDELYKADLEDWRYNVAIVISKEDQCLDIMSQ